MQARQPARTLGRQFAIQFKDAPAFRGSEPVPFDVIERVSAAIAA